MARVDLNDSVYKINGKDYPNVNFSITREFLGLNSGDGSVWVVYQNGMHENVVYTTETVSEASKTNVAILTATQILGYPFKGIRDNTSFAIPKDLDVIVEETADNKARITIENVENTVILTNELYSEVIAQLSVADPVEWGDIEGDLEDQIDLSSALDGKVDRVVTQGSYGIFPDSDGGRVFNIGGLGSRFSNLQFYGSTAINSYVGNSDIQLNDTRARLSNVIGGFKQISVGSTGITIRDDDNERGLTGHADYSANYQDLDYVQKAYVDSVAGDSYTFENGLTESSGAVGMGGNFASNILLVGTGGLGQQFSVMASEIYFTATDVFNIQGAVNSSWDMGSQNGIGGVGFSKLTGSDGNWLAADYRDTPRGLEYADDYSSNFTDRSLVDKAYVDSLGGVSELSDLSDVNTSTATDGNVLVADGTDWESRALVESDISDLGDYLESVEISDINASGTADGTTYLRGDGTWSTVSGGGGITNDGASNELVKSDGTNVTGTGIFSSSDGNLTLGSGSLAGASRTITADSSGGTATLIFANKTDNSLFTFNSGSFNLTMGDDGTDHIIRPFVNSSGNLKISSSSGSGVGNDATNLLLTGGGAGTDGDGGDVIIQAGQTGGGTGVDGNVFILNLPTSDPAMVGALWNSSGTLMIST